MTQAEAAGFVYVGSSDSQDVTVLELTRNGDLTPVQTVAVPGPAAPGGSLPMALSPDKTRLFVGLRNEPFSVATFAIDGTNGKLSFIGSGPLPDSMCSIAVDASGRHLAAASYGGNKVVLSPIGADGVVQAVNQIVATEPNAHCILFDPTNRYVLHTSLGGGLVYQQIFDAESGTLMPNTPNTVRVTDKGGPRHLVFAPDARFVYVMDELDAVIHVFPWDAATGTMKATTQSVTALPPGFAGKPWGADIHVTPDGNFLYASERTSSTLAAFRVDGASGALMAFATYPTERQPRGFAIDPSGDYLIAAGQLSDSVTVHAINRSSGALTALNRYAVGKNPNWIEIV